MSGLCRWIVVCALIVSCVLGVPRQAQADEYEKPTAGGLVKALIRFGAVNIRDDDLLNDYARAAECKLYTAFYHNDFKWHQIQAAMRQSIKQNVELFPTGFYYDSAMRLGRYDFKAGLFRFSMETKTSVANTFTIAFADDQQSCNGDKIQFLPTEFRFVLDQPVQITGVPLTESDANQLVQRMDKSGNEKRIIFVRFNLRVVYIGSLEREHQKAGVAFGAFGQPTSQNFIRLDARLDSIDYYEDEQMTKLIYSYRQ